MEKREDIVCRNIPLEPGYILCPPKGHGERILVQNGVFFPFRLSVPPPNSFSATNRVQNPGTYVPACRDNDFLSKLLYNSSSKTSSS